MEQLIELHRAGDSPGVLVRKSKSLDPIPVAVIAITPGDPDHKTLWKTGVKDGLCGQAQSKVHYCKCNGVFTPYLTHSTISA